jgi:mannose-6-phosphate isomerase-like protein (cupin superfamily)
MTKYTIQKHPFRVPTNDGKVIDEHFGQLSIAQSDLSIAHMVAPAGWSEPFQTPDFEEYTFIIKGQKQFNIDGTIIVLKSGQSIKIEKNVRVQYSNPFSEPCEYLSICKPAFTIDKVHRDQNGVI